jgi:hypothetical protein
VVYNKATGQPSLNLKKDNFAIFVDGVKKDITNFATPEAPITLTLVVEYSKTSELLGFYGSGGLEAGQNEVIGSAFVVIEEVILDGVGAMSQAEDKILVPEVGVVLHHVPQDRPVADMHHRLGHIFGIANPHALPAAK